jgi:hypothetical protein
MKVEELKQFGAPLEMPKEALKQQGKIMLRALRQRFGIVGMLGIFKDTWLNERRLRRDNPETHRKAAAISETIEKELCTVSAVFLALAKRLGREEAYEFFKTRVMDEMAPISMRHIYQLEDLKKCEGDIFKNFKKSNIALFQRTTKDGTWHMDSYTDDPDKLTLNITTCANVELFGELGVPELGKFGCDHDLAGYAAIEDDVDCEFRRLCTIAKGDPNCVFEFYRKGTAPDNAYLNK